jgi:hypothetical protein
MVAPIVVRHTRMLVDLGGSFVDAIGIHLRGYKRALVSELSAVEDGTDLANHTPRAACAGSK